MSQHAGTPARYVSEVMSDLFTWLKTSDNHPLIKGGVFHFEFEYIHPFSDGNGRTGRMWHSLILRKLRPVFTWLPIETLVHNNQQGYYDALAQSQKEGESTEFVEFMLAMIRDALDSVLAQQRLATYDSQRNGGHDVIINGNKNVIINKQKEANSFNMQISDKTALLEHLRLNPNLTIAELSNLLGKSPRQISRILASCKESGLLEHIGPNKGGYWKVLR